MKDNKLSRKSKSLIFTRASTKYFGGDSKFNEKLREGLTKVETTKSFISLIGEGINGKINRDNINNSKITSKETLSSQFSKSNNSSTLKVFKSLNSSAQHEKNLALLKNYKTDKLKKRGKSENLNNTAEPEIITKKVVVEKAIRPKLLNRLDSVKIRDSAFDYHVRSLSEKTKNYYEKKHSPTKFTIIDNCIYDIESIRLDGHDKHILSNLSGHKDNKTLQSNIDQPLVNNDSKSKYQKFLKSPTKIGYSKNKKLELFFDYDKAMENASTKNKRNQDKKLKKNASCKDTLHINHNNRVSVFTEHFKSSNEQLNRVYHNYLEEKKLLEKILNDEYSKDFNSISEAANKFISNLNETISHKDNDRKQYHRRYNSVIMSRSFKDSNSKLACSRTFSVQDFEKILNKDKKIQILKNCIDNQTLNFHVSKSLEFDEKRLKKHIFKLKKSSHNELFKAQKLTIPSYDWGRNFLNYKYDSRATRLMDHLSENMAIKYGEELAQKNLKVDLKFDEDPIFGYKTKNEIFIRRMKEKDMVFNNKDRRNIYEPKSKVLEEILQRDAKKIKLFNYNLDFIEGRSKFDIVEHRVNRNIRKKVRSLEIADSILKNNSNLN